MVLEELSQANAREAIEYLERRPYDNVYVHWLIASGTTGTCMLARDAAGAIVGFCHYGPQIVPCSESDAATAILATYVRRSLSPRMLVGPRVTVERFARDARRVLPHVALTRESQPVYAIDRARSRGSRDDADVRRGTVSEVGDIAKHSARMIAGEVGRMPDARNPEFVARTARIARAGWWWRYLVDGKLAFQCNVGSVTERTAQIQGVWSPPEMRENGHARRALGAICDRLLDEYPTLCLYVNDFNTSAIALYERVGFTREGEFQTLLF